MDKQRIGKNLGKCTDNDPDDKFDVRGRNDEPACEVQNCDKHERKGQAESKPDKGRAGSSHRAFEVFL